MQNIKLDEDLLDFSQFSRLFYFQPKQYPNLHENEMH